MSLFSFLSYAQFRARTIMPVADLDRVALLKWAKGATDLTAADVTPETPLGQPGETVVADCAIAYVLLTAKAPVAPSGVNYATITISKRTQGGAPVVVAQTDTTSVGWGAMPIAIPLVGTPPLLAGDMLTAQITKSGTGVLLPVISVVVAPTPNWVDVMLAGWSDQINARLRKRYAIPQTAPYPETILRWLTKLGTRDSYAKRGWNPTSEQDQASIETAAENVLKELIEAADSEKGLIELPLRADLQAASGVSQGGPLFYSEQSPYTGMTRQAQAGRQEDRNR